MSKAHRVQTLRALAGTVALCLRAVDGASRLALNAKVDSLQLDHPAGHTLAVLSAVLRSQVIDLRYACGLSSQMLNDAGVRSSNETASR
jgi:hypothetical protein